MSSNALKALRLFVSSLLLNRSRKIFYLLIFISTLPVILFPVFAKASVIKTPNDVYANVMILEEQVKLLRAEAGVDVAWPEIAQQKGKSPRHVLQKSIEVLEKIRRLRMIRDMGEISVPLHPLRDITPSEVFDMVERLTDEMVYLLPPSKGREIVDRQRKRYFGKYPDDVYRELWVVSRALDPVLGVRGFNPTDVYRQSLHVLEEVRFLRLMQKMPLDIAKPELTEGSHPNHALKAAYGLLGEIADAEENLWVAPVEVPKVPRRVIEPNEVYDALQVVMAELHYIKYRLGMEGSFERIKVKNHKTPDDVIQNLRWATLMMPNFGPDRELIQSDPALLKKTPSHVFLITEHILAGLREYRAQHGIETLPRTPPLLNGLEPKHVYQKTLESLEKAHVLRLKVGLRKADVPEYPLREITPVEVFDLASRLDEDLDIVFNHIGIKEHGIFPELQRDKTPTDVYMNMWRISYLLDTLLGIDGYTPDDVYREARRVVSEVELIANHLGYKLKAEAPPLKADLRPEDVFKKSLELLDILDRVNLHAGILWEHTHSTAHSEEITPNDVFNEVRVILAELIALKVHLGITDVVKSTDRVVEGKKPGDVYKLLDEAYRMLQIMLESAPAS